MKALGCAILSCTHFQYGSLPYLFNCTFEIDTHSVQTLPSLVFSPFFQGSRIGLCTANCILEITRLVHLVMVPTI